MSECTPSLMKIRAEYTKRGVPPFTRGRGAEFDRAIAKVRADAKVEALREAAEGFRHCADWGYRATRPMATEDYLRARADALDAS